MDVRTVGRRHRDGLSGVCKQEVAGVFPGSCPLDTVADVRTQRILFQCDNGQMTMKHII